MVASIKENSNLSEEEQKVFVKITSFSSILAGIVGKLICHPMDTLRAKLQVQRQFMTIEVLKKGLIRSTLKETLSNEGVKGLYKGLGISLIGTGPAFSLYLTSYEISKNQLSKIKFFQDHGNLSYLACGFIAEIVSCILWLPIDVVKERMQVQKNLGIYNYKNALDAILTIQKTEGIVGLYRAYGATLASFGPFSAMYFLFYEKFKEKFCSNPKSPQFFESMVCAGTAGSLAGVIANPLEIVKLRMQVQRASKAQSSSNASQIGSFGYKNVFHGVYLMVRTEGIISLTKGSFAKVLYTTPNTAITMSFAELFRSIILKQYKKKND